MKLLFCEVCQDVFKLDDEEVRSCKCGKVRGRYNSDGHTAVVNGKGSSLAFGNGSLFNAVFREFAQFDYKGKTTFLAWWRPHSGPENPHTIIQEDL